MQTADMAYYMEGRPTVGYTSLYEGTTQEGGRMYEAEEIGQGWPAVCRSEAQSETGASSG